MNEEKKPRTPRDTPRNGKKIGNQTHKETAPQNQVMLITSEGITKHANVKSAMSFLELYATKVPVLETELNNTCSRLGVTPADPSTIRGRHIFEVRLGGEGKESRHYFSLPFYQATSGHLLDAATINKDIIIRAAISVLDSSGDRNIKSMQDHLVDTYLPVLNSDNLSFASFLPLLTNPESIKATAYVQVHSSLIESSVDENDPLVRLINDYVTHDDSAPVVVPLLNQKLISSPKIAPLLTRLFSDNSSSKSTESTEKGNLKRIF